MQRSPALGRVAALWAAIVLIVCVRTLVSSRANGVYPIFAGAARDWLAGADLYRPTGEPYRYSPLATVLVVPFGVLPDGVGGTFWRLLNIAVYLGGLGWWSRAVLPRSLPAEWIALLFLLVVPLSVGSLNNGQSNALVLGLLLAGTAAVARKRWTVASVCVAVATVFKLYPLAIGLLIAVAYPRRFGVRFGLALAVAFLLPFACGSPGYVRDQYVSWIHHLGADNRQVLPVELWYRDLRLLCHTCHVTLGPQPYVVIQLVAAAACAGVVLAARRARWDRRRLLRLLLALGCVWMTLFGSATESCTYILLAPSLGCALLEATRTGTTGWARGLVSGSFAVFLTTVVATWLPGIGRAFHTLGPHPLAALLFLLYLGVTEVRALVRGGGLAPPADAVPAHAV